MTIGFPIDHFLLVVLTKPLYLTVSEMFNGECDAIIHVTLNDLETNVKVPIDFSYTTSYGLSVVTFPLYRHWHLTPDYLHDGLRCCWDISGGWLWAVCHRCPCGIHSLGGKQFLLGNCSLAKYCCLNTGPQDVLFEGSQVRQQLFTFCHVFAEQVPRQLWNA